MRLSLSLLFLLACGSGPNGGKKDSTDTTPTVPAGPPGAVDAWVDPLIDGSIDGYAAAGGSSVALSWDGASWRWLSTDEPELLSLTESPVEAAAATSEGLWLVLDERFLMHDGVLREVAWADQIDGRVDALTAVGDRLWIRTDSALHTRWAGRLSTVLLDGVSPTGPTAVGRTSQGQHVLWTALDNAVFALDPTTGEVWEGSDLGARVTDLSVDVTGRVHALAGGEIWVREASWAPIHAVLEPADVPVALYASPTGTGTWIQTEAGWLHHDADRVDRVESAPVIDDPVIDGLGRLVHADAAGLQRTSARRPVDVVGILPEDRLNAPTFVTLVPTAPETLTELSATLVHGEERIDVAIDPDGTATLDPLGRVFGRWTLELLATHGAESHTTTFPLRMRAAGGATWTEHVQPIYESRCSMCHDGASETVLDTPESWETSIDVVLEKVISGEMPLVGPALESSQIALIQAWAEGGFPQ